MALRKNHVCIQRFVADRTRDNFFTVFRTGCFYARRPFTFRVTLRCGIFRIHRRTAVYTRKHFFTAYCARCFYIRRPFAFRMTFHVGRSRLRYAANRTSRRFFAARRARCCHNRRPFNEYAFVIVRRRFYANRYGARLIIVVNKGDRIGTFVRVANFFTENFQICIRNRHQSAFGRTVVIHRYNRHTCRAKLFTALIFFLAGTVLYTNLFKFKFFRRNNYRALNQAAHDGHFVFAKHVFTRRNRQALRGVFHVRKLFFVACGNSRHRTVFKDIFHVKIFKRRIIPCPLRIAFIRHFQAYHFDRTHRYVIRCRCAARRRDNNLIGVVFTHAFILIIKRRVIHFIEAQNFGVGALPVCKRRFHGKAVNHKGFAVIINRRVLFHFNGQVFVHHVLVQIQCTTRLVPNIPREFRASRTRHVIKFFNRSRTARRETRLLLRIATVVYCAAFVHFTDKSVLFPIKLITIRFTRCV